MSKEQKTKHKIRLVEFEWNDDYGSYVQIDGERIYEDAYYTANCLEAILKKLGVDFEIEYFQEYEIVQKATKKMKLVEDT